MSKKKTTETIYIATTDGELSTGAKFKNGDEFKKSDLNKEDFDALREMAALATKDELEKAANVVQAQNVETVGAAFAEMPAEIIEEVE